MTWQEFLAKNRSKLSPYEVKFVERVLSQVPGLDFATVQAQTPFTDGRGRRRRIDFTITQGEHVRIAIEVDGWDKTGSGTFMTRDEFDDWSRREVTMTSQRWLVLRFANRLVDRSPKSCARHIALVLKHAQAIELSQQEKRELERLEHERAAAMKELEAQLCESKREVRGMKTIAVSFAVVVIVIVLGVVVFLQLADRSPSMPPEVFCEQGIDWSRAQEFIGTRKTIKGPVVSARDAKSSRGSPTFLNIGADSGEKGQFTVVIWEENLGNFPETPERLYGHKTICVTGVLDEHNGVPQINLKSPASVSVQQP